MMLTLLFDIDGTLLRAGGAGFKAMRQVASELFGIERSIEVSVHGRTDHGIVADVLTLLDVDVEPNRQPFVDQYVQCLEQTLPECAGHVLPGVVELLDALATEPEVSLGLLTGNTRQAAAVKLQHFGLSHYFSYGGYGDDHSNRNDVAGLARQAAARQLGDRFNPDRVWVIGDTVNDIRCARSIAAKVMAVETGGGDREELIAADPDLIYATLPAAAAFLSDIDHSV